MPEPSSAPPCSWSTRSSSCGVRDLTRQQALRIGAVLHLVAFGVMTFGASDVDAVVVIVFGAVPAALLFLAAFAMQRRAKSSAPAAGGYASPPSS